MKFKYIFLILINLALASCIQEYMPKLGDGEIDKIVIYGNVTNKEGFHLITVSTTSETTYPRFYPLSGCSVSISDDRGNSFLAQEADKGEYKIWIDQAFLNVGTAYKLDVITPNGDEITSEYDTIPQGAILDSLYYFEEEILTNDPKNPENGIQFYTDLKGKEGDSKYYKFLLTETWEYHTAYPRQAIYDGTLHLIIPVDSSKMVCWRTEYVHDIYTLSLENISTIEYTKNKLHFINDYNERRAYGYSLRVDQLALSKESYYFHSKLKDNDYGNTNLYNRQPELIKGNLVNITNPNEEVLGFFFASSVSSKRIFVEKKNDESIVYNNMCDEKLLWRGLKSVPWVIRPAYILLIEGYPTHYLNDECVDCTTRGGFTEKPDFWPY